MATTSEHIYEPSPSVSPWATSVAGVLGSRAAQEEHQWEADADELFAALAALVASGRCRLHAPGLQPMDVVAIERTTFGRLPQGRASSPEPASNDPSHFAVCFRSAAEKGEGVTWILAPRRLTYLPARAGSPAERVLFQLLAPVGPENAFIHADARHDLGRTYRLSHTAVLLADRDLDVAWMLLANKIEATDIDGLGEAVRHSRRASYVSPEERASKERAIAAIRDAYEKRRGPKPRPLSQDDVDVIVDAALDRGLLPNLELIHAVTGGRGSPNQTYPKVHDAVARRARREARAESDIDAGLLDVWNRLRDAAIAAAEKALAPARLELADANAEVAAARQDLSARERDLAAATQALKDVQADLTAKLDERERTIRKFESELAKANRDLSQAQRQLGLLKNDTEKLEARCKAAEEERDRERAARRLAQDERDEARRNLDALDERCTEADRAANEAEGRCGELEATAAGLQQALAIEQAQQTTLREANTLLRDELERQRRELNEANQRNGRLEATVDNHKADLARLQPLESQLQALKEAHAAALSQLSTLREERDRLAAAAAINHEPPAAGGH